MLSKEQMYDAEITLQIRDKYFTYTFVITVLFGLDII